MHVIMTILITTTDKGYHLVRKATQQVPHDLPSVRKGFLPHPKEDLLFLRIPFEEDQKVQLGREGQGSPNHRNWPNAIHEDHDS